MDYDKLEPEVRIFHVRAFDDVQVLRVEGRSFEDAAIGFLERWDGGDDEVSLIVQESETGERHCFLMDLEHGGITECGS